MHRGAFCQFPFRWIYYCHSSKLTRKKNWQNAPLCSVLYVVLYERESRYMSDIKDNYSFSRMLKELKAPQNNSNAWCSQSDRLQMAEDTLRQVFHNLCIEMWYPDSWISRHFWLAKYPDTKKVEYPIIQLSKELRYPSIRILNHLRYPTIHVSIDTWIHGYIQLSIYPCIQVSMDTNG